MNSRPSIQTTLFNSAAISSEKPSQVTQNKTQSRAGNKPDLGASPYDFLLSNWTDYFGDDGDGNYNVILTSLTLLKNFLGPRL